MPPARLFLGQAAALQSILLTSICVGVHGSRGSKPDRRPTVLNAVLPGGTNVTCIAFPGRIGRRKLVGQVSQEASFASRFAEIVSFRGTVFESRRMRSTCCLSAMNRSSQLGRSLATLQRDQRQNSPSCPPALDNCQAFAPHLVISKKFQQRATVSFPSQPAASFSTL